MEAKTLYSERMGEFWEVQASIENGVRAVFGPNESVTLDDLYETRLLLNKSKEVLKYLDQVISARQYRGVNAKDRQPH